MKTGAIEDVANRLNSLSIHMVRRVSRANMDEITPSRLSLLSVIVFGGVRTVSELARAQNVSVPAVTRMMDALEKAHLIWREAGQLDRRTVRIFATEQGIRLMEAARAQRVQHIVDELSFLSLDEVDVLLEATRLLERVEDRAQGGPVTDSPTA
jgi:DNA-binding MarR family transcriptional regulator